MKKINILKYVMLSSLVLTTSACRDNLLDTQPKAALSPGTFYQDKTQCDMGLTGVYNCLPPNATVTQWFQFDFMSDNGYCQDAWQGSKEIGEWATNANSWGPSAKWTRDYEMIVRANEFLANMEHATVSDDVKRAMTGEARFLRAYAYADLITYFGDVPLILTTQKLDSARVKRTPKATVLAAVLADYDAAIDVLPVKQGEAGRATKGAAYAMKARILLYNDKWAEAAEACRQVMALNAYSLFGNYGEMFKETNENNSEVIFDIQYIKDSFAQPWPSSRLSFVDWPTPNVTADMIDSYYMANGLPITDAKSGYDPQKPFVNRDPRLEASVVLPGSQTASGTFIPANDQVPCGARPRKYADIEGSDSYNCSLNTIVMRYADVLLMRAEALVENGETGAEVYGLINQVRQRVGMPAVETVEGSGLSQEQLRRIIRHERRVEFFMEGTRYADMLRWKDPSLVHDVYGYVLSKLSDPKNPATWVFETEKKETRTFDEKKGWLWPIPLVDRQNNNNLTQNPGY